MSQRFTYSISLLSRPPAESYTFSAKEKDSETGFSYFGSRYYSSDLSIWLSVDPMSEKYPHQSSYVYCGNNPIMVVDPNGEDEWEIDEQGTLTWKKSNTEIDILHATKTGQSKDFPVGTIKDMTDDKGTCKYNKQDITVEFQYLDINDDELATRFFEFVSENTEIEWSLTQTGESDNRIAHDVQYLSATGEKMNLDLINGAGNILLTRYLKNKISVRAAKHSHPFVEDRNIVAEPSFFDIIAKDWILDNYGNRTNINYEVYGKKDGSWQYMPY